MFRALNLALHRTILLHGEFLMSKDVKSTCSMYHMLCRVRMQPLQSPKTFCEQFIRRDRREKNEIISDGGSCASNVSYSHPFRVIVCVDLIFPDTLIYRNVHTTNMVRYRRLVPGKHVKFYFCISSALRFSLVSEYILNLINRKYYFTPTPVKFRTEQKTV